MHKNYDVDIPDYSKISPPTFELGGETFTCLPMPAGGVLPRLQAAARLDERGKLRFDAPNIILFIQDCLRRKETVISVGDDEHDGDSVEENTDDVGRWNTLMDDETRPIPVEVLWQIVNDLAEEYGKRPTQRSKL